METRAQWINNDFVITIKSFEYNSRDSHNTIMVLNGVAMTKGTRRDGVTPNNETHSLCTMYIQCTYHLHIIQAITD